MIIGKKKYIFKFAKKLDSDQEETFQAYFEHLRRKTKDKMFEMIKNMDGRAMGLLARVNPANAALITSVKLKAELILEKVDEQYKVEKIGTKEYSVEFDSIDSSVYNFNTRILGKTLNYDANLLKDSEQYFKEYFRKLCIPEMKLKTSDVEVNEVDKHDG